MLFISLKAKEVKDKNILKECITSVRIPACSCTKDSL